MTFGVPKPSTQNSTTLHLLFNLSLTLSLALFLTVDTFLHFSSTSNK